MKYFKLFILLFIISSCTKKETVTTTYYLIRHAEKDRTDATNKDPNLNEKGLARAKKWAEVLKDVDFDMVYATNYKRTQQTASPTAKNKNLEVLSYNPNNLFDSEFEKATKGKTVLVVGHSNTTPTLANKILDEEKYEFINDRNNANLYIITTIDNVKFPTLLKVD